MVVPDNTEFGRIDGLGDSTHADGPKTRAIDTPLSARSLIHEGGSSTSQSSQWLNDTLHNHAENASLMLSTSTSSCARCSAAHKRCNIVT
eukprot:5580540-Amphidinium_carterae.1